MFRLNLLVFAVLLIGAVSYAQSQEASAQPPGGLPGTPTPASRGGAGGVSFNPDISAIVDLYYHADDSEEGISHVLEEMGASAIRTAVKKPTITARKRG